MHTYDWQTFLPQWSRHLLSTPLKKALPTGVASSGWIGFPGASPDEIAMAENRLQTGLPPSYRQFLQVSNGWRMVFPLCGKIWPVSQIDWLANSRPDLIDAWLADEQPNPPLNDPSLLVASLQQQIEAVRSTMNKPQEKPFTMPVYQAQRVEGLRHTLHKVIAIQEELADRSRQAEALELLAKELEHMALANAKAFMKGLDMRKMAQAGLLAYSREKSGALDQIFEASGKSVGYSDAAQIIREFLSSA